MATFPPPQPAQPAPQRAFPPPLPRTPQTKSSRLSVSDVVLLVALACLLIAALGTFAPWLVARNEAGVTTGEEMGSYSAWSSEVPWIVLGGTPKPACYRVGLQQQPETKGSDGLILFAAVAACGALIAFAKSKHLRLLASAAALATALLMSAEAHGAIEPLNDALASPNCPFALKIVTSLGAGAWISIVFTAMAALLALLAGTVLAGSNQTQSVTSKLASHL